MIQEEKRKRGVERGEKRRGEKRREKESSWEEVGLRDRSEGLEITDGKFTELLIRE